MGAGFQLGGVQGVGIAGQPAACGGELGQRVVHAAALSADGGQRDGIISLGQALAEGLLVHLLDGEEERKLLLPGPVDGLGGLVQAAPGGEHQGDLIEVGVCHALPRVKVERLDIHSGGGDLPHGVAVVHAVYVQPGGDEAVRRGKQLGGGHLSGVPRHPGQRLPQLGGGKDRIAVEQQAPGGIGVGDGGQRGGAAGSVYRCRALFAVDELNGRLVGVVGVLDQAQAVDAGAGRLPPQEQAAGRPVVEVERPAGKGGLGGEAVGAAGGVEKLLVTGHRAGQRQLGEKILVRAAQAEHQRQRPAGRNTEGTFRQLPGQYFGAVLKGRKLHGVGGVRGSAEHPPEGEDEILRRDGAVSSRALGSRVGQAVLQIKGIGLPVGGDLPPLAQGRFQLAVRVFADKAAVEVLAGDDVRRSRSHLRVKVRRDGVHEPGKAVGA